MNEKNNESVRPWIPSYDRRKKPWRYQNASDVEETFMFAMKTLTYWLMVCVATFLFVDYII